MICASRTPHSTAWSASSAPVARLDEDLRRACLEALELDRGDCRDFALRMTWEQSAAMFLEHVTTAQKAPRPPRLARWTRKAAV